MQFLQAKQLQAVLKFAKEYSSTAMNVSIVALMAAMQQLTSRNVYRCPCVSQSQLSGQCKNTTLGNPSCTQLLNIGYGLSFIFAPAIGVHVFGMAINPKLWKSCTGYLRKTKDVRREIYEFCWTICEISSNAIMYPAAWISFAMLDGKYFACAATAMPYDVGHNKALYATCENVSATKHPFPSNSFNTNRSLSQMLGWIIVSVGVVIGFIAHSLLQCCSPLTFYHAKFYKYYKNYEESEFEEAMKKTAQSESQLRVQKFMELKRSKSTWDRVSTVHDFHRDVNHFGVYSHLHEWIIDQEEKEEHTLKPLLSNSHKQSGTTLHVEQEEKKEHTLKPLLSNSHKQSGTTLHIEQEEKENHTLKPLLSNSHKKSGTTLHV